MKKHILVVDGIGKTRLELSIFLKIHNIEVIGVKDIPGAIEEIPDIINKIEMIIVDADEESFEIDSIKNLKIKEMYKKIPLIIVSHHKEKKYIIRAIEAGATEYIIKPFSKELIINKISSLIGLSKTPKPKVIEESYSLDDSLAFSLKDILTIHFKSLSRGNYPLSVIMLRIINTKEANEAKREIVLETMLKAVKMKTRETDIIIRYGIDNILILLPFTDNYGANFTEKKIREHFLGSKVLNQRAEGFILATSIVTAPEEGREKNYVLMKLKSKLKPTMFFSKDNDSN